MVAWRFKKMLKLQAPDTRKGKRDGVVLCQQSLPQIGAKSLMNSFHSTETMS